MNTYYSNEVDSHETLPLLLLDHTQACVLTSSSESEVGMSGVSCLGHSLPHSIIRGDNK